MQESLSAGEVHWLSSTVADGTASPDEARSLLVEFVRQAHAGSVSPRMIEHVRDCLDAYLSGRRQLLSNAERGEPKARAVTINDLDKAFGLKRATRGQPAARPEVAQAVAAQVLARLLAGESLESASAAIAEDRKDAKLPISSETQVKDAWAAQKRDALVLLRLSRTTEESVWSRSELAQLKEIYSDVPGVVLPGEKPFKGRHSLS